MTRAEAIEELKVLLSRVSDPKGSEQGYYSFSDGYYVEALNMAIKTLKQEQTTDVISRQDAIDAVVYDGITTLNADERKLLIEQIPSAELKRGRWIDDDNYLFYANCSECGYQMDTHEERGYHNYCPNCGARMESDEE